MLLQATYPTVEHQTDAETIVDHFVSNYKIDAVLLVNSCARGKATRDSCLDITVLAKPDGSRSPLNVMEADWEKFESSEMADKTKEVEQLLNEYAPSPSTVSDSKPDHK